MKVQDLEVSGCIWALEEVRNPVAYLSATLTQPFTVIKTSGRMIQFRLNQSYGTDTDNFSELISSLTYGDDCDTNVVWEFCFSTKSKTFA